MKTAVIGASGFIGRHLLQAWRKEFPDCVGTRFSHGENELEPLDLADPAVNTAALRLSARGHGAVLIAAARSRVDYCESYTDAAYAVNVSGTLEAIRQFVRDGLAIIFLSSDYVFDGLSGNYEENAPPAPATEYGRQKAHVEQVLPSLTDDYLIVRLSKVYGLQKQDKTLLDEMAERLASGREVQAAVDQFFSPVYVGDVVRAIQELQSKKVRGTVHVCGAEAVSRYQIARSLADALGAAAEQVKGVSLHDVPGMQGRPLNTSLRSSRLQANMDTTSFNSLDDSIKQVAANWRMS